MARGSAHLLRWLGPWSGPDAVPGAILRRTIQIDTDSGAFPAWWYTPTDRAMRGSWILAQGLHFLGPTDPRMDRFARILASAGFGVLMPHVRDYMRLMVTRRAIDDFAAAFERLLVLPDRAPGRPAIWSVSFGSLLALRLASHERLCQQVGGLMTFGGYGDWIETSSFCLTGEVDGRVVAGRDPLNQPAVFLNVLDRIEGAPDDTRGLKEAWLRYCQATWGQERFKRTEARFDVAHRLARDVPGPARELFLQGCGVGAESHGPAARAVARFPEAWAHLDPRPHLHRVRCPVCIVHAADDEVIPPKQRLVLAAALPDTIDVDVRLTGLYGHSDPDGSILSLRQARTAARELGTMLGLIRSLSAMPTRH
jgi:pimeloyl-ACP methyl ester carboxylesterase